jgi:leucyl aminopeptidase (aminopeptidase T)
MNSLEKASETIWTECMGLKKEESSLVVYDEPLKNIGYALHEAAKLKSESFLLKMKSLTVHGEEPPPDVARTMKAMDVVVIPTSTSLTHTRARKEANAQGARIATLPMITEDTMKRAIHVDYEDMRKRSETIADLLTKADSAHITTEKGTDLEISLKGRKSVADFGIYHDKGDYGNLPAGEAFIAPLEGESNGTLVVDGAIAGIGKLEEDVYIAVEDGLAKTIENCPQLVKILDVHGAEARNIAELGIGTNEKATITGNILEDEKVMGTVHVALGNNASFGGTVNVSVHLDCIVLDPTFTIGGKQIIDCGKLLV